MKRRFAWQNRKTFDPIAVSFNDTHPAGFDKRDMTKRDVMKRDMMERDMVRRDRFFPHPSALIPHPWNCSG